MHTVHEVATAAIDAAGVAHFRSELRDACDRAQRDGAEVLVLDFGAVGFMDSTGVATLIGLKARLHGLGIELELQRLSPTVARTMEVLGLSERFGLTGTAG